MTDFRQTADTRAPDLFPVTYLEEEWIRAVGGRASDHNVPLAIDIEGSLDHGLIRSAFQALAARHETLRTAFDLGSEGPQRSVWPAAEHELAIVDLTGVDTQLRDKQLNEMILEEARCPTDLTRPPLWRGFMVRLTPRHHVLVTVWHHAIFDGWSSRVFFRDLAEFYASGATSTPAQLPQLDIQMADYAAWERQLTLPATTAAYWRHVLPGEPPRLPVEKDAGSEVEVIAGRPFPPIHQDQVRQLEKIATSQRATLASALRSVVLTALRPYLPEQPVIGLVYGNRERPELQPVIGLLSDHLLVKPDLSGNPSFLDVVTHVHTAVRAARTHHAPLGAIINALPGVPARDQMFDVSINNMRRGRSPVETVTAPDGSTVTFSVRNVPATGLQPRVRHAFTGGFRLGYQLRYNAGGEVTGEIWGHLPVFRTATLDMLGNDLAETACRVTSDPHRPV